MWIEKCILIALICDEDDQCDVTSYQYDCTDRSTEKRVSRLDHEGKANQSNESNLQASSKSTVANAR